VTETINNRREINGNSYYVFVPYHHGRPTADKSVWQITNDDEFSIFLLSINNSWIKESYSWSHFLEANQIRPVGVNFHGEDLYFGKFINENAESHGYPADYRRKIQDRPPVEILLIWEKLGVIKSHHISKILRGIKCNL